MISLQSNASPVQKGSQIQGCQEITYSIVSKSKFCLKCSESDDFKGLDSGSAATKYGLSQAAFVNRNIAADGMHHKTLRWPGSP